MWSRTFCLGPGTDDQRVFVLETSDYLFLIRARAPWKRDHDLHQHLMVRVLRPPSSVSHRNHWKLSYIDFIVTASYVF